MIRFATCLALLFGAASVGAVADEAPPPRPKATEAAPTVKKQPAAKPKGPPAIDGPKEVEWYATFRVTNLADEAGVDWQFPPSLRTEEVFCDTDATGNHLPYSAAVRIAGPAGAYTAKARLITIDAKTKRPRVTPLPDFAFSIKGTPGPVPPGPTPPDPIEPPPEPAKVSRFVVVEDTSKPGLWRGQLMSDPKVIAFVRDLKGERTTAVHAVYSSSAAAATLSDEGKRFVGLAAGKELPHCWLLDAVGTVVKAFPVPKGPDAPDAFVKAFDTHVGERQLGLVLRAPRLEWATVGTASAPNVPLIARAQWPATGKLVSLRAFLPPTHDQDGRGQCASSAACGLLEFCRKQVGLPYVYLSAGDLYGRQAINGGRDGGSYLEDNMQQLLDVGVEPVSKVPYVWDGRMRPSTTTGDRGKYRFSEVYLCRTFDAAVSAILQGFAVEIGMDWYSNFQPDAEGMLPKTGRGYQGGHALFSYGVYVAADGTVYLLTRNSWSASFGGSADGIVDAGSCLIPESLLSGSVSGFFAVRAVQQTAIRDPLRDALRPDFALAW